MQKGPLPGRRRPESSHLSPVLAGTPWSRRRKQKASSWSPFTSPPPWRLSRSSAKVAMPSEAGAGASGSLGSPGHPRQGPRKVSGSLFFPPHYEELIQRRQLCQPLLARLGTEARVPRVSATPDGQLCSAPPPAPPTGFPVNLGGPGAAGAREETREPGDDQEPPESSGFGRGREKTGFGGAGPPPWATPSSEDTVLLFLLREKKCLPFPTNLINQEQVDEEEEIKVHLRCG